VEAWEEEEEGMLQAMKLAETQRLRQKKKKKKKKKKNGSSCK